MTKPASNSASTLVEDFVPRAGTFRLGMKPLNTKSVKAAHGDPNRVIRVAARHLTREIRAETNTVSGGRILPHLTANNYVLAGPASADGIEAAFKRQLNAAGVATPVRRDCIVGIELVFSLASNSGLDTSAYFNDCLAWAEDEFKPAPIISAIVHLDEACPHMHVLIAPIINGRMQGGKLFGYRAAFNRRNGEFHTVVAKKYGLDRPKPKLTLSAAERAAYTGKLIEEIAHAPSVLWKNMAVCKALSRLIAADPLPLGRALNVPPPSGSVAAEEQTVGESAHTGPSTAVGNTGQPGGATSSLCYDVANALSQPIAGQSANATVQIDSYDDTRAAVRTLKPASPSNKREQIRLTQIDERDFVYDRDNSQPASTWVEELGCHVAPAAVTTTNKARADAAVSEALRQLAARRAAAAPFASHTILDQEFEHDD